MRTITLVSVVSLCLLSACVQPRLEPEEVLKRSFFASSMIDSYAFSAQGFATLRGGPVVLSGSVVIEGVSVRTGAWSATISLAGERILGRGTDRLDGIILARMPGNNILYLNLLGVAGEAGDRIASAAKNSTHDGWTALTFSGATTQSGTPSQDDILAQASLLQITADRTQDRSSLYEFDVVPQSGVLSALTDTAVRDDALIGTLWIDRKTFALQKAKWTMVSFPTDMGLVTGQFDVTFSSLNSATLPVMPLFTGSVLEPKTLLDIISGPVPISS